MSMDHPHAVLQTQSLKSVLGRQVLEAVCISEGFTLNVDGNFCTCWQTVLVSVRTGLVSVETLEGCIFLKCV